MLDVTLLGTGGMMPLPNRFLTALMVRYKGEYLLIDCGEGTQVAVKKAGWGFKQIKTICFTHFHADHIAGLPGMLLTIGNAGRTQPLSIIGPAGVQRVVDSLRVIAPELPFAIECRETDESTNSFLLGDLRLFTIPVSHGLPCYAYKLELERQGKFNVDRARELNLPIRYWSVLQSGCKVEYEGNVFHPADVLGEKRKGIRLCYATDLRPSAELVEFVRESDLFVCEGIYGDPEKLEKAVLYHHCLFSEAAGMARDARVKELWLTHFSPALTNPEEFLQVATDIFPNTHINKMKTTLAMPE